MFLLCVEAEFHSFTCKSWFQGHSLAKELVTYSLVLTEKN